MHYNRFKVTALLILFSASVTYAQEDYRLNNLRQQFESFQYNVVIAFADSLLNNRDTLNQGIVSELYLMKGISHFSLQQDELAKNSFTEILKIDSAFSLDSAKTSPKIIAFFNDIRKNSGLRLSEGPGIKNSDIVYVYRNIPDPASAINFRNTFIRSLVLPGWGHLYRDNTTKGTILTSLGALTLISSVYFIFDSNSREDDYTNAVNIRIIPEKYDEYNTSYKLRNYSLIAFAAVWLYAQLDLLLFSDDTFQNKENLEKTELSFTPRAGFNITYFFSLF